jgi:hypothetical protein
MSTYLKYFVSQWVLDLVFPLVLQYVLRLAIENDVFQCSIVIVLKIGWYTGSPEFTADIESQVELMRSKAGDVYVTSWWGPESERSFRFSFFSHHSLWHAAFEAANVVGDTARIENLRKSVVGKPQRNSAEANGLNQYRYPNTMCFCAFAPRDRQTETLQ